MRLRFDPPGRVVLDRAHIWRNGIEIDISRSASFWRITGTRSRAGLPSECQVGLAVGDPPEGLGGAIFVDSMRAPYPPDAPTEPRVVKLHEQAARR